MFLFKFVSYGGAAVENDPLFSVKPIATLNEYAFAHLMNSPEGHSQDLCGLLWADPGR